MIESALIGASVSLLGGMLGDSKSKPELDDYAAYQLKREQKWDAMYGPLEQNLVDYYNGLDPTKVIAEGNTALEKTYAASQKRISESLASRGLDIKGGVSTSIMRDSLTQLGRDKAQIYAQADDYVAKQQSTFLSSQQPARPNANPAVQASLNRSQLDSQYQDQQDQLLSSSLVQMGTGLFKDLKLGGSDGYQDLGIDRMGG